MTRVVNKRSHRPTPDDVYIGRGSLFGNPYKIGEHGSRNHVIGMYEDWLNKQIVNGEITVDDIMGLDGKNLVCYCHPLPCHGMVLIRKLEEFKLLNSFF